MQDRMEEHRIQGLAKEERDRLNARENDLRRLREAMQSQERELDAYRVKLKEEQLSKEREFQRELEAREKFFAEREKSLLDRQREFEQHLIRRQAETESMREHLQNEVANREAKLQQAIAELQQEKERYSEESRRKIEKTSKDYVADALDTLDKKEKQFHRIAKMWSGIGAGAFVIGIAFFAYVSMSAIFSLPTQLSWEYLAFAVFKGLVAITLLAGLARYSFLFSSSYMQEALKNADRRHAINFGKFYLESYGAAADWSQVQDVFKHWNISGTSAFARSGNSIPDGATLEKVIAFVERANKAISKKTEG